YLPFGELFVSQRNSEFDSRYKFTAKELDNETSYTYFGARYYDTDLSSCLSVDPLSDKYPSLSPYLYSADNPVVLVDPNGMLIDWYMNEETGELYYNKDRSSQTTQYNNKTYTRIGDNNMFGDMGNTTEKAYNYEQSQNFAEKNGYSINSTQQLVQHETKTYSDATSPAKSSSESITIINEKYGIFSSDANHKVVTKSEHLENDFGVLDFIFAIGGTSIVDSRSRVFSTYLNDSDFKKSGLKEEMVEKIPAGTLYTQYKSWDDYSIRTKGKGELLIYRKKE
ncbi:MAG: RHS repeat-associated core domain-containing protein, partial [Bacteroidales bacterium]